MSKTNIKCPRYNSDKLYKFGLNKQANQKYQCKQCKRQFSLGDGDGRPKLNNPKCPACGKGMYLHHKYKYHVSFKCNNRQCNHTIKQLIPSVIDDPSSEKLFVKDTFSGHRFSINTIINAINLYYSLNVTTIAISIYLLDYINIKVSHVTISKWIKKFDKYYLWICIDSETRFITSWKLIMSRIIIIISN